MAFAPDTMESAMSDMDKTEQFGQVELSDKVGPENAPKPMSNTVALSLTRVCLDVSRSHMDAGIRRRHIDAYRAFQNQHMTGSKYDSANWRGRTRHFRPKTRSVVRGSMAAAASALFSSLDAVQITATNEADELSRARAAIRHELVNYRLDRSSGKAGMPWFLEAMGALQDARITSICVSKQFWQYEATPTDEEIMEPLLDEAGNKLLDDMGQPIMRGTGEYRQRVRKNRPMIRTYPVDQVHRDPTAHWTEQAQEGGFVILENPMSVGDVVSMMKQDDRPGVKWRDVPRSQIVSAAQKRSSTEERAATRRAREGNTGRDRYEEAAESANSEFANVWVHENFLRYDGQEWHYWSLGSQTLLSDPVPLEEAYPEQFGARPIVIGYGSLESHKIDPLSMVDQLQPLQREENDVVNLTLDATKQSVAPMTLVKRHKNINVRAVQNRSSDSVVFVHDKDDVTELGRPGPGQAAFHMLDRLSVDMDELSGSFSSGSVMSNRTMNETVGGMQMLRSGAELVADLDMKVWIETWLEPVLRQTCNLEGFYEADETVIAICGEKAKLREKFGITVIDGELLGGEVTCRVDVSAGADPMQKLQRLGMGIDLIGKALGERAQMRIKDDEFISEVLALAGYRDGDRFFEAMDEMDPRIAQMQQAIQQLQEQLESKQQEIQSKVQIAQLDSQTTLQEQELENQGRIEELMLKLQAEMAKQREATAAATEREMQSGNRQAVISFLDKMMADKPKGAQQ